MRPSRPTSALSTHEVTNQPGPRPVDLWNDDAALRGAVAANHGQIKPLSDLAARLSDRAMIEAGREANRHPPELRAFDRAGRRLDEVAFSPSYHRLMETGIGAGYSAIAWEGKAAGGHVTHAAMVYLMSQVEPGVCCPMTMTYAAVPALAANPAVAKVWRPKLVSRRYDPAVAHVADKTGATLGMAMTEKQGGSDVRANTTTAQRDGDLYILNGHKWFCSAPMSDGFLTLAQADEGLTCFLVPRWLDGRRNGIHLMRLKDKLGNRANASAEIEYHDAVAWRLGNEGAGVRTIIEMVHHTRLDTAMAPAGLMRAALAEAVWWAEGRSAFQKRLIDQPLMRAVLSELALDAEGALALGLRVARAFDSTASEARAFARIAVALAKFLSNKRAPNAIYEAMEALGGMGYVEDTPLPMLYREAPLNSIWEGSGNVICLDILRTLERDPAAAAALDAVLDAARGVHPAYDSALSDSRTRWPGLPPEAEARAFAERIATLLTAATLAETAPHDIAEAYAACRLDPQRGQITGTATGYDPAAILRRVSLAS
ncbi:acyl-CoA dehydrogenase family protein [Anianabacter salinae]|uniref:acyl-CoA dehydrogenase family protein n=1 Tax=Anianabacter salinae TaxID=2851023 RepID=UPI00225E099A|nr:acyl-CoA dehydrogenase family protein [Anianabacter salinae]MBV0912961.1 acyl-CoA dehydrogenase family protein [Anianabacter salinae]